MTDIIKYNHSKVESKWQKKWEDTKLYVADIDSGKNPFYNLYMFPYPSAEGLHAGHVFSSTGSDVYGRFMRMNGHAVFQPMGYDSFGIHPENYAIKTGEHPKKMLDRTIEHYGKQFRSLGHGYDWTRSVITSDLDYYRWTQWLFVQMFKAGLAYKKKASVNFCPSCKTVLADEQVMSPKAAGKEARDASGKNIDPVLPGYDEARVCERCGTIVEKRDLDQWFMRITDYAERLLSGLTKIDWSERVKLAQKEWIGKKSGVIIHHKIKNSDKTLDTFSAYPAWLFADTFLVMAPEHPLVPDLVNGTKYEKDVLKFVENFKKSNEGKQTSKLDEKEGIFTGTNVINPFDGKEMPVWLANFALMDFGTGIIRCSAHDIRDYEFATKYRISLKEVVERTDLNMPINAHGNEGILKDSGPFSGKSITPKLIEKILDWIEKEKIGERNINYHLRDWLVSRQRYWGAPIPMIYCEKCGWNPVPEKDLPVLLPNISDYKPKGTGSGPLADHPEFFKVKCPKCGEDAIRETDVMDTFVDSSWYFLRYPSVGSKTSALLPFDPVITKNWLPVNLYFGGAEHSVLHLMYARFVTMVLKDLKYLNFEEPFTKFYAHGLIIKDGAKMSKSRGNVVNPDEYVAKFGADTLRLYTMFIGPMDGSPDFRDSGMEGMQKFVDRLWKLFTSSKKLGEANKKEIYSKLHQTIKKVTDDISEFKYNTAIAGMMELTNFIEKNGSDIEVLKNFCLLLAPFAPHLAEEVWVEVLGQKFSVHKAAWPKYDETRIVSDTVTVAVQINGKVRSTLNIESQISSHEAEITELAKKDEKVAKWLNGQTIKKTIFIPGKVINFVI